MGAALIRVNDTLIINPAHIAYAERSEQGLVTLHMAAELPKSVHSGATVGGGHAVLTPAGDEAVRVWAALSPPKGERYQPSNGHGKHAA